MSRPFSLISWRGLALGMTAACGGLLMPKSAIGGGLLLLAALVLGVASHKWVRA